MAQAHGNSADRDHGGRGGRGHDHAVTATSANKKRLQLVLAITVSVLVAQTIGAWLSGSLSLLADAGHMLTDSAGIAIALLATTLAQRPSTNARTFGWQRAEVLAALANATILCAVGVLVIRESFLRWGAEPEIQGPMMLWFAVGGALANTISLVILARARGESLNMRGAYLEVFGDLVGSLAVIIAAIVVITTGYLRADVIASFTIGLLILPRAISLLKDVADVLLESTPRGMDLDEVREHILALPAVTDVHDLHAWTITSGVPVMSAHIVLEVDERDADLECATLDALSDCLDGHFDVSHCTFQLEPSGHAPHEPAVHA